MIKSFKLFEDNNTGSKKIWAQLEGIKTQCQISIISELKRIESIYIRGFNPEELTYDDQEERDFNGVLELTEHIQKQFYYDAYDHYETHPIVGIDTNGDEFYIEKSDEYEAHPISELDIYEQIRLIESLEKMVSYTEIELKD